MFCIFTVCEMPYLHPHQSGFGCTDVFENKGVLCVHCVYFSCCFAERRRIICFLLFSLVRAEHPLTTLHRRSASPLFSQSNEPQNTFEKNPTPSLLEKQDVKRKTEGARGIKKKKKGWSCVLSLSRPGQLGALPWFSMKAALIPGTSSAAQHSCRASSFLGKI